ncbi:two-component system, response regulator YesN [Enterococcus sp. AZ194]|uniref:response regulator transcription factor n=1 Tax=Enterococcus sp. AZ194 TaxID=2774629 RepID=UPI003F23B6E2
MKKILVVDDEQAIREGLTYLIDWESYGYEIIGTAKNGKEGLQLLIEQIPDLVITDIKMPQLNGLDMIKEAKKLGHCPQAIALSGYSEFEYAKKAIQLDFFSYLLKPIDEEELIESLTKLNELEESERTVSLQHELVNKLFGNDAKPLVGYTWVNCLRTRQPLEEKVLAKFKKHQLEVISLSHYGYTYQVLLSNATDTQKIAVEKLVKSSQEIISTGWVEANQNLGVLYSEINYLSRLTFLFPNQYISPERFSNENQGVFSHEEIVQQLVKAVVTANELKTTITNYAAYYYNRLSFEEDVKWQINQDYHLIIRQVRGQATVDIQEFTMTFSTDIFEATTFDELLKRFTRQMVRLSSVVAEALNNVDIISEILHYVSENYIENLSLKSIAEKFNYNSAYLGKKFRKETGKSFVNYLEGIRMEKAASLLSSSNLMVYEISEQVGYKNVDYFYKKFRQYYKISPNEYRNLKKQ